MNRKFTKEIQMHIDIVKKEKTKNLANKRNEFYLKTFFIIEN
jgi:hypothetical protein